MGWATGSELAEKVWEEIEPFIEIKNRDFVALRLTALFEDFDCDTIYEAKFVQKYLEWNEDINMWQTKPLKKDES